MAFDTSRPAYIWAFLAKQPGGLEFLTSRPTGLLAPTEKDFAMVDREWPLPAHPTTEQLNQRLQRAQAHQLIRLFAEWKAEQVRDTVEATGTKLLPHWHPKPHLTLQELLARYQSGERDFAEVIIESIDPTANSADDPQRENRGRQGAQAMIDLTGINLYRATLQRLRLDRVILRAANLTQADLSGASLGESDLSYARLTSANLSQTWLHAADLRGADLSNAYIDQAMLDSVDLRGATLLGTTFENVWMRLPSVQVDADWQMYLRRFSLHPSNDADQETRIHQFLNQQVF